MSGGRCLVDFNHPLSGKDLVYDVRINKIVEKTVPEIKNLAFTIIEEKNK